jgi:hypothetical protein
VSNQEGGISRLALPNHCMGGQTRKRWRQRYELHCLPPILHTWFTRTTCVYTETRPSPRNRTTDQQAFNTKIAFRQFIGIEPTLPAVFLTTVPTVGQWVFLKGANVRTGASLRDTVSSPPIFH